MAESPPFDPLWINASAGAPAYAADELRRALATMMLISGSGANTGARAGLRPGPNTPSLSGTTISVFSGTAVLYPGLTATSGPYLVQWPGNEFTLDPADPTNPRKDIVILRVFDDDEDLSGRREAVNEYLVGTPAPSPTEPATPAGALKMAVIDVPAEGGGSATLTRTAQWTVASGGILPVRDDTELPTDRLYEGLYADLNDDGVLKRYSGSAWETVARPNAVQVTSKTTDSNFGSVGSPSTVLSVGPITVDGSTAVEVSAGWAAFTSASSVDGDVADIFLSEDATTIQVHRVMVHSPVGTQQGGGSLHRVYVPTAGTYTWHFKLEAITGSGWVLQASTIGPTTLAVKLFN